MSQGGRFNWQFNREVSWIQFNERVLHEALDPRTPLLERVKFLQIFTTNLDEFFMKRVGGLKRQKLASIQLGIQSDPSPTDVLCEIRSRIIPLLKLQSACWSQSIAPTLEKEGILLLDWNDLHSNERENLELYFHSNIFPVLTPLSVDSGHPFPFISNLSNSLGVLLRHPIDSRKSQRSKPSYESETLFARIKIPSTFPQWVPIKGSSSKNPKEERWISLEQIITRHLDTLFPGMEILDSLSFRLTRNADLERDEEDAEDLLEMITEELRERRFAEIVRLEHGPVPNHILKDLLIHELELEEDEIYENATHIDFSSMSSIFNMNRPALKYRPWTPVAPQAFLDEDKSIFNTIRDSDVLVHHPYESFHHSVERFVQTAVNDPQVLAIKMVLYRTGTDSPFTPLLIQAAEAGKQVVCLVELKARFDEERNIQVARSLEKAGVHVVYGIVGLKTHCKVILVVRQEGEQVRSYAHIGTGNYHASTARLYTDLGLFTAKSEFTEDISKLFHFLTGHSLNRNYKKLIIAPLQMKDRFLELIEFEAKQAKLKKPAKITAKMNSLEDPDIIQALYRASKAGVKIDLIVRGFCCLQPQIPGLSENIHVSSIIGRYLEHSRIFFFQHGEAHPLDGIYLIGSADWMSRNLTARVEAIVPIEDRVLKNRIYELIQIMLHDQRQVWDLGADGFYKQRRPISNSFQYGTHDIQMKMYENTPHWPTQMLLA